MADSLRDGLFTNFVRSAKGAVNATRMRGMTPAQRRAFENKVIKKRKKKSKRKTPERAVRDATRSRDVKQAVDLRDGVNPKAATKRRMKKAGVE